jgi:predicted nucleic acid-binding protein
VIALDTNILIWGVKGVASPNREAMIPCAKALLGDLERNKQRIIIPSQVLAEFLVSYGDRDRIAALDVITKRYLVAPLDTKAALIAAELCHDKDLWRSTAAEYGKTR